MEEQKLTDDTEIDVGMIEKSVLIDREQYVLLLKGSIWKTYKLSDVLDLIHRLQDENGKLKTLVSHFEQLEKQLSDEIERLKKNHENLKERYVKILDLNEKVIAEQKAEIERLTREKSEDVFNLLDLYEKAEADIHSMEREADGYRETIAELQKQVNELKEELEKAYEIERANIRAEIADAGTSCHWCERQTVKEIFTELLKNENVTTTIDRDYWGEEMIISAVLVDKIKEIAKRKGVEVE
jgi:chromosome segregation ATPase